MKKLFSALLAAAMIVCPFTSAFAADADNTICNKFFKTGGVSRVSSKTLSDSSAPDYISTYSDPSLPTSYSSVDEGYVTPVKNQGSQNTCTIFSAAGAMESALLKNGYGEYDLSEEYLNYWASSRNDGKGWLRDRVNGGALLTAGHNSLNYGGVIAESELPYMSGDKASFEDLTVSDPLFYAGAVRYITDNDHKKIKRAVMDCGAVSTSFCINWNYLNKENNSYCCNDELTYDQIGGGAHAILIVGWDDNYPKTNFLESHQPQNDGAWLIKNSWGEGSQNYDYIWVSYEDKYLASYDNFGEAYAIEDIIQKHTCNSLLSIDQFGPSYNISFDGTDIEDYSDVTFINIFDFSKTMPVISNVEFQTGSVGAEYEIYYIPVSDGAPVSDKSEWTALASGRIEYEGVQNVPVDDFRISDHSGAIGVRINAPALATFGCCEWLTQYGGIYAFLPRTQNGRSFYISGDSSYSLSEYYASMEDDLGGNFSISLVTNVRNGDVNKDGEMTIADAIMIQKDIVNILSLDSDTAKYVADMDGDGGITVADAIAVQKIIVGILAY